AAPTRLFLRLKWAPPMICPTSTKSIPRATLMLATIAALTLPAQASELPRYQLKVGQELTFIADNRLERRQAMSKRETVTWTAWVIGKAGDDGWKLVVRRDYSARYTDPSTKGHTLENSKVHPVKLSFDGRLLLDSSLDPDTFLIDGLRTFLPLLPKDQAQVQKGYEEKSEANGFRYRVVKSVGQWQIEAVSQGLSDEIYEIDSKTTYTFDTARGLPVQATMKSEQKSLLKTRLEGMLRLKSVKAHGAAWATQASAEAKRFFAALRVVRKAYQDDKSESLKRAADELKAVQVQVKSELFQKPLEDSLKYLEREIKAREHGGSNTAFLGKTVNWKTTDLDGKNVTLADFKSKILVLDYWYRGCFWCVRSMPQLNELAEHYKGKPVAILGMNIDADEADARFVIRKMGLKYATLKAGSTRKDYGVAAFPTILILNDKGVVCDFHIGYAPDLKEILIKKIDKLLNERE
ncbi:MAG: TlpA family protein disulfide reductase, partial [Gemmataceae bacterium]